MVHKEVKKGRSFQKKRWWKCLIYLFGSHFEFAVPLWTGALTMANKHKIERIQANATDLILGPNKLAYPERLRELQMSDLETRRSSLDMKFCKKFSNDPRIKSLFPTKPYTGTRSKGKFIETKCKTKRFYSSAIPTFIRLLNKQA